MRTPGQVKEGTRHCSVRTPEQVTEMEQSVDGPPAAFGYEAPSLQVRISPIIDSHTIGVSHTQLFFIKK